jgi:Ni/Co efflux regulator RcnB
MSVLSLLLLSAAITALPVAAQPVPEEAGAQAEDRESREPRFDPTPRPGPELRESAEAPPERLPGRAELVDIPIPPLEPRAPAPASIEDVTRAAVEQPPEERVRSSARREGADRLLDGTRGRRWREDGGERRGRARDIPPSASSPVFGSAIPTADRVIGESRDGSAGSAVSGGQPSAGGLRGRIAAEGLRRDRIENENWRREWRENRRYDWRRHRDRDRSRFHLGIYIDPFGWRYRDWDVGWRLPARYYASRYWIHDPWDYRLPPVTGPYRWVRYHDDVLLVDLRSGRVLDRIRNFFW